MIALTVVARPCSPATARDRLSPNQARRTKTSHKGREEFSESQQGRLAWWKRRETSGWQACKPSVHKTMRGQGDLKKSSRTGWCGRGNVRTNDSTRIDRNLPRQPSNAQRLPTTKDVRGPRMFSVARVCLNIFPCCLSQTSARSPLQLAEHCSESRTNSGSNAAVRKTSLHTHRHTPHGVPGHGPEKHFLFLTALRLASFH